METLRGVSKVLLFDQNRDFILQKRDQNAGIEQPGKLSLFGGGVESDETNCEAAKRELEEEIGVEVNDSDLAYITSEVVANGTETIYVHYFLLKTTLNVLELVINEGKSTTMRLEELKESQNLTPLLRNAAQKVWLEDAAKQVHPPLIRI